MLELRSDGEEERGEKEPIKTKGFRLGLENSRSRGMQRRNKKATHAVIRVTFRVAPRKS